MRTTAIFSSREKTLHPRPVLALMAVFGEKSLILISRR